MRIFVSEFLSGGGMWTLPGAPLPSGSLLAEGRGMLRAVALDLTAIDGIRVVTTLDDRLENFLPTSCQVRAVGSAAASQAALSELASEAEAAILIAPETDGILLQQCLQVERTGCQLFSPGSAAVRLASNKQATAERLAAHGVPVPAGIVLSPNGVIPTDVLLPTVAKPIDGCGSQGVQFVRDRADLQAYLDSADRPIRLEAFAPGLAASVALLCGRGETVPLPACEQRLSRDGRFAYLGGRTPLPRPLDQRARRLAMRVAAALPPLYGYVGIDLVLGEADDGTGDRVIEVNPRLTTSYLGLRAACRHNLAQAMLAVAEGKPATLSFRDEPLEFAAE